MMGIRVIRMRDVQHKLGVGRATVYDWLDPKSRRDNPTFPRPISLGANSVGWLEREIDDFIEARIRASRPTEQAAARLCRSNSTV